MGKCKSLQYDLGAQNIWNWVIKRDTCITAVHIPGALNTEVNEESRKSELQTECKLNEIIFTYILDQFEFYFTRCCFYFSCHYTTQEILLLSARFKS